MEPYGSTKEAEIPHQRRQQQPADERAPLAVAQAIHQRVPFALAQMANHNPMAAN